MKLFRFMSINELRKYTNGENLINTKDHNKEDNKKTDSVGFCFFNYAHYRPEEIFHSVTGIVNCEVCCLFETERKNVRMTHGRYSRAINTTTIERESFISKEYCTTEYNKEDFKLLSYAIPDWFSDKWEWKEKELK